MVCEGHGFYVHVRCFKYHIVKCLVHDADKSSWQGYRIIRNGQRTSAGRFPSYVSLVQITCKIFNRTVDTFIDLTLRTAVVYFYAGKHVMHFFRKRVSRPMRVRPNKEGTLLAKRTQGVVEVFLD